MNPTQKAKITRFLDDTVMSDSVYDVLLSTFLKPQKNNDVQFLAASRIAIDLLQEAWKTLDGYRIEKDNEINQIKQIGL